MKINQQKKKSLLFAGAVVLIVLIGLIANAAVPKYITFQGVLTDADGKAVTGTKSMVFKIYTDKTGGSADLSKYMNS